MKRASTMFPAAVALGLALMAACAAAPTVPLAADRISASIDERGWSANRAPHVPLAEIHQVYDGARLHLRGHELTRDSVAREVEIIVANFAGLGAYVLGAPESGRWAFFKRRAKPSLEPVIYMTDDANGGTLTVTSYDEVKRKVEGEFAFSARMPSGAEVSVAHGRFSGEISAP